MGEIAVRIRFLCSRAFILFVSVAMCLSTGAGASDTVIVVDWPSASVAVKLENLSEGFDLVTKDELAELSTKLLIEELRDEKLPGYNRAELPVSTFDERNLPLDHNQGVVRLYVVVQQVALPDRNEPVTIIAIQSICGALSYLDSIYSLGRMQREQPVVAFIASDDAGVIKQQLYGAIRESLQPIINALRWVDVPDLYVSKLRELPPNAYWTQSIDPGDVPSAMFNDVREITVESTVISEDDGDEADEIRLTFDRSASQLIATLLVAPPSGSERSRPELARKIRIGRRYSESGVKIALVIKVADLIDPDSGESSSVGTVSALLLRPNNQEASDYVGLLPLRSFVYQGAESAERQTEKILEEIVRPLVTELRRSTNE